MPVSSGRLAGKVAVITGGANGIGRAAVLRFLAEGARVVAGDLDTSATAALVRDAAAGDALRVSGCDVTAEDDVAALVELALTEFGQVDCMYNNAGTSVADSPLLEMDAREWQRIVDINLNSVFYGIKHGARAIIRKSEGGSIINTASLAALSARSGPASYSAAKAAVVNLTQTAAVQLASHRVRVNVISPGWIMTSLILKVRSATEQQIAPIMDRAQPWPSHGTPDDIAAAAAFLASDDSRFVTGHNLVVDGGMTAAGPRFLDRIKEIEAELRRG